MVVNFGVSEDSTYVQPGFFTGLKIAAKVRALSWSFHVAYGGERMP